MEELFANRHLQWRFHCYVNGLESGRRRISEQRRQSIDRLSEHGWRGVLVSQHRQVAGDQRVFDNFGCGHLGFSSKWELERDWRRDWTEHSLLEMIIVSAGSW